ncbi:hypothetical protein PHSY_002941 [Pseudozyma hubeiensis SY62]|uniref:Uncharacterized protein n=1 Tax=Pseudozyma hubeiensis (strain SY62) TaxID=1305764 RepID=R9P259_PSEHS|nr:hypothetical protein PHSY_002941 [Pseudozyma hubeiensis SY62]GAC95366.1 hypothetical protein PHSY_002941 [Pseudozyma hubeiensis SY62]
MCRMRSGDRERLVRRVCGYEYLADRRARCEVGAVSVSCGSNSVCDAESIRARTGDSASAQSTSPAQPDASDP